MEIPISVFGGQYITEVTIFLLVLRTWFAMSTEDCSNPIANALELMQSYTKPSSSWWRHMLTVSVTVNYLEIPPRGHSICSRLAHLIAYSYDPKYLFHLRKFYIAEMQTKQIVLVFPV